MPAHIADVGTRKKIIHMRHVRRLTYREISVKLLREDNQKISPSTAYSWVKKEENHGKDYVYSSRRPTNARQTRVQDRHLQIINQCMQDNPELSSVDLQKILLNKTAVCLSSSYIRKLRVKLGWTYKKTKYCQLVRDGNKVKRLEWAQRQLANHERFDDVIFSDEASFEAQRTVGHMYYKKGHAPPFRPKPKHPLKVCFLCF